ncbi:MAG: 16S rRNA (adenine(1518)-N(6)/adenine(1519)-N(6))-dimethyltransferase RsmA [Candidatus Heimdallarchaeum aukensis]|uniref:Probable ribosomal RNA small subunit methyltransferase A n=1 Tax=Candidatus Heimdallarchaeum aukensis TaxID=2876573 RepID=A0A9Y1BIN4_9ARCH|nr:MAG: 16S rRNA (adenine(1518)-N(6)/adenine(1519)-N(6))-dimethyltransferase RsmA [Candidatus Heimdallarchaeum aukensis]
MTVSQSWCWRSSKELRHHVFNSLKYLGVSPTKLRSQNFLIDSSVIKYQIEKAEINKEDIVLEIGGGLASLTKCLAEKAKKVYCIELDRVFSKFLQDFFSTYNNVEIISGDALKIEWPSFSKSVSNLPYQISSPITFKLLEHSFQVAVLMYQKEFADRLFAEPGSKNYSRLSVMIKLKGKVNYLKTINEHSFYPQPKVKSALVAIKPINTELNLDIIKFGEFITSLFTMKGKTVRSALKISFKNILSNLSDKEKEKLEKLPFIHRRIFTLTQNELIELYNEILEAGWYSSERH